MLQYRVMALGSDEATHQTMELLHLNSFSLALLMQLPILTFVDKQVFSFRKNKF